MDRTSAASDVPIRSPAAVSRFVLTALAGLSVDLATKAWAADRLGHGEPPVTIIPGWLQLEFVRNPGAVFGIAQGQRAAFLAVSVVAIGFLSYLFANSGRRPAYQVILGMLMAGVVGNMYDRIAFRSVRDMIHAVPGWHWPAAVHRALPFLPADVFPYIFNVADSLLCVGVGVLLVSSFFAPREPARPTTPAATPANP